MNSRTRLAAASLALIFTVASTVTPAWASESWQLPPIDLSVSSADVYSESVRTAAGPDGSLMVMWEQYGESGDLMARFFDGAAWSDAPVSVSGDSPDLSSFRVVSRGGSSYVAIWNQEVGDGMTLSWSVFEAGTWSAPEVLFTGDTDEEVGDIGLVAAPSGAAVASWSHGGFVHAAARTALTWSTILLGEGSDANVAVGPDDTFAVAWGADVPGVTDAVASAKIFDGSTWSDTETLGADGGFTPILAASPSGFVAMWTEGGARLPRAATFDGSGWSDTHVLRETNELGGGLSGPDEILSTPAGTVVTWNDGSFGSTITWMAVFDGEAWGPTIKLLDATEQAVDHRVAGDSNGSFLIVWQSNGGGPLMVRPFTATTPGDPVELSSTTNDVRAQVVAGSNGYFAVVWADAGTVYAQTFDGQQWSAEPVALDGFSGSPFVTVTSENGFVAGWEWSGEMQDRGTIRSTSIATPNAPDGGGDGSGGEGAPDGGGEGSEGEGAADGGGDGSEGEQLAKTGAAPIASAAGLGAAVLLLLGAAFLAAGRRLHARASR